MLEKTNSQEKCFCGCKADVGYGRHFAQGHDKLAEAALIAVRYGGSVVSLLRAHGYGPDAPVVRDAVSMGVWHSCPHEGCRYAGAPVSVRRHLSRFHPADQKEI